MILDIGELDCLWWANISTHNEEEPKNEDKSKYEEESKNEENPKNEDSPKHRDNPKNGENTKVKPQDIQLFPLTSISKLTLDVRLEIIF